MPTYDYFCTSCGHEETDVFQKITDKALSLCGHCQQETLKRRPGGGIGLSFSGGGDGFYATMYGQNKPTGEKPVENGQCCPCGKNKTECK